MDKEIVEKILNSIDEKKIIDLTRSLVRIPSVSKKEKDIALFLVDNFEKMGLKSEIQEKVGGLESSANAIGELPGTGGGSSLMFNGHIDHVTPIASGWTKDPYGGEIEDGYLYGIGTTNMKAGIAAIVSAVDTLIRAKIDLKGDILLGGMAQECIGGVGAKHMVEKGITADYAVVTEATDNKFVTRHIGVTWQRITVIGETTHYCSRSITGKPLGIDAIRKMYKIIDALGPSMGGKTMETIKPGGWLTFEPKEGWGPMLNVGFISGGKGGKNGVADDTFANFVPDYCTIKVDFRLITGMSNLTVQNDLLNLMNKLKAEDPELNIQVEEVPGTFMPAYEVPTDSPLVKLVGEYHELVTNEKPVFNPPNAPYPWGGTDASTLQAAGTECLVYGPGGHFLKLVDEHVELRQIIDATKVLALTAADICNRSSKL